MTNARRALREASRNLAESMGVRSHRNQPKLSPIPHAKDQGRRPSRDVGTVPLDSVTPDPDQPRKQFSAESIERMAQSIRDKGQLAPIRVRWSAKSDRWLITGGERRWRAARQAGLDCITCIFCEDKLTRSEVLEEALIDNMHREDLKPVERAKAFSQLMTLNDWNGKQLAQSLRLSETEVSRDLRLLSLPSDLQEQVDAGKIPKRTAHEIARLKDESAQRKLADQAMAGSLTHTAANEAVGQRRGTRRKKTSTKSPRHRLTFGSSTGLTVAVSVSTESNYHHVEKALTEALSEVQHRIKNGVTLL